MRVIVLFLFFFAFTASAQTYRYIGVEDGLSNRRIFNIQKDSEGYMWFLTNEGMDRFNGKDMKHYKLIEEERTDNSQIYLGWLYMGKNDGIWVIGQRGCVFQYEKKYDRFKMIYKLTGVPEAISYGFMDENYRFWLCSKDSITIYNTLSNQTLQLPNILKSNITVIKQVDKSHFFIATETSVRYVEFKNNALHIIPHQALDRIHLQANELYYHRTSQRLFVGTFEKGVFAYDMHTRRIIQSDTDLSDVSITRIRPLNQKELLVATEGMGIYKINVNSCEASPYIVANYESYNEMNGNNINDIYIDEKKRIWLANYPTGVTVIDHRYTNYHWIKHSVNNKQSLVNDQVYSVIEDCDGDLWFGTSNGISYYDSKSKKWHSFLSSFDRHLKDKNNIFITLCEVSPGIIWAGGYTSGLYKINKKTLSVEYFSPSLLTSVNIRLDKYIRAMIKDSEGYIWSGGYYNLKCFDLKSNSVRLYPGVNSITAIEERDANHMWIGTSSGLYLLNRNTGKYHFIEMSVESNYINALYQTDNGLLYIGTSGSGLLVYNIVNRTFEQYSTENSALVSNGIFAILPELNGNILMSTENGITSFSTKDKSFHNWTREQGLMSACFNAGAGVLRKNKDFVFGSIDGAIQFPENVKFPNYVYSKMIFSDFLLSYQPTYPGEKDSPLTKDINETNVLKLSSDQNTFSFRVSSINYDFPANILYYWKLEGFYDEWVQLNTVNIIRFTNLNPGEYTLRVRAVSKEESNNVFEERQMKITIAQPLWLSGGAILIYTLLIAMMFVIALRLLNLKKQKKISDEKTRFFINTAHDIRTPLTLIKAPLEELLEEEVFSDKGTNRLNTALRNVDVLLRLTTNLINFERADVYSSELHISEYELNAYIQEACETFRSYATIKHIDFTYESQFSYLNVWFDKEKMDSILKNLLSNALKYTPEGGRVNLIVSDTKESWKLEIRDTGIGIPASEQNKLFKVHFRGANVINSKITGSGIGLMLVWKLVRLHGGKINIESTEQQGTVIKVLFPKGYTHFRQSKFVASSKSEKQIIQMSDVNIIPKTIQTNVTLLQRILIVEDNDELRFYLVNSLSGMYNVQACSNGKEALIIVKEFWPELILSDIMMPEMRGDELCLAIKSDIETSHIPILLLTALGGEENILEGLQTGADEYIVKPFSIVILRARISNILANRTLLRNRYINIDTTTENVIPTGNGINSLDWKFMSEARKNIEENLSSPDFTVDSLCSLHNMSRTSFYNKLKAMTGQAPADYIRIIRLKRAAQLLQEGDLSITEVAEMTGFSDSKYFREVFKKHFNISPSKYGKEDDIQALSD